MKPIPIRRFNIRGINEFRNALISLKEGTIFELPENLFFDPYLTEVINNKDVIEFREFVLRKEIIEYLSGVVVNLPNKYLYDIGFWSWLASVFFNSICPAKEGSVRKVGEESRYILNTEEWTKYYRHLLAAPVRLNLELGDLSKIYLTGKPDVHGDMFEQLASRNEIASNKGIIEAAIRLYWDKEKDSIKRGARNKDGPGVLRRFVQSAIPQFQRTYDLNSMTADQIISLLPQEYETWL